MLNYPTYCWLSRLLAILQTSSYSFIVVLSNFCLSWSRLVIDYRSHSLLDRSLKQLLEAARYLYRRIDEAFDAVRQTRLGAAVKFVPRFVDTPIPACIDQAMNLTLELSFLLFHHQELLNFWVGGGLVLHGCTHTNTH